MKMQDYRRNVRICWLTVLFIVIFFPSDIFMADVYGIGSVQCPPCTRWIGYCQPYCDNYECQATCAPNWTCCPSGGCIPPENICCGQTACPNPDNCCDDKSCYGTGWSCCGKGNGQTCPNGYTCHGTSTCCEPDGDYCPGFYLPPFWDDCCPSGFSCKGDGRCCPDELPSICVKPDGSYTCYDPSDCQKTCINGQVLPCNGDPKKCCVNGVCKGPICDNCHPISRVDNECGHSPGVTICQAHYCIKNIFDSVTCDYHPDSTCPSKCAYAYDEEGVALTQEVLLLDPANCPAAGEPVNYHVKFQTYIGCPSCHEQDHNYACDTSDCSGTKWGTEYQGEWRLCGAWQMCW